MKILQILPYYAPAWAYGGPPRVMYDTAIKLTERGHTVSVCTTDAFEKDKRIGYKENIDRGIHIRYFRNISNSLAWNSKKFIPLGLGGYLDRHIREYDIVHFSGIRNYLNLVSYRILKKNAIPYAVDAHGALPVATGYLKGAARVFDRMFTKPFLSDAKLLFAQTSHEADAFNSITGDRKTVKLMPLSVDLKEFGRLPSRGGFRSRYGIGKQEKLIVFLGRISKDKGIGLILEIFRKLGRNDTRLVIIGRDDGYLDALHKQAGEHGISDKVIFTGPLYSDEKKSVFADCDLFLFTPGYWEETSMATLEALACGLPVITVKQAEIPFLEEYRAGFNLERDAGVISAKVSGLLDDELLRNEYSSNALKLINERYDSDKRIVELEGLFEEAIKVK